MPESNHLHYPAMSATDPVKLTEKARPKGPRMNDTAGVTLWLGIFGVVGLLFVGFGVADHNFVTAIVWALACFLIGALIGFLFGIPRVLQGSPAVVTAQSDTPITPAVATVQPGTDTYDLRVNTNLEQISDWLTKIIVGLGLVELRSAPARLQRAATYIARGIGPGTEYFAGGLLIYFTILGFIGTYLITRLYIAGAFSRADRAASKKEREDQQRVENIALPAPDQEKLKKPLAEDEKKAARNVAGKPLSELTSTAEIALWAKAQLSLGNYEDAVNAYRKVVGKQGDDLNARYAYATALYYSGAKAQSFAEMLEVYNRMTPETDKGLRRDVYRSLTYKSLFQNPPKSFEDSVRFGEAYVKDPENLVSPGVWVNLAAAYGQKTEWLQNNSPADAAAIKQTRDRALTVVRQTVGMGERWKRQIRELMDKDFPDKEPHENYLEVFAAEPEFRTLAGLPPL